MDGWAMIWEGVGGSERAMREDRAPKQSPLRAGTLATHART